MIGIYLFFFPSHRSYIPIYLYVKLYNNAAITILNIEKKSNKNFKVYNAMRNS